MQYLQLAGQSLVGQKVLYIVVFNCSRSQKAEKQAWKKRLPSAGVGVASFALGTYQWLGQAVPFASSAPPLPPLPPLDPPALDPPALDPEPEEDSTRGAGRAQDGRAGHRRVKRKGPQPKTSMRKQLPPSAAQALPDYLFTLIPTPCNSRLLLRCIRHMFMHLTDMPTFTSALFVLPSSFVVDQSLASA
jgi:hypothetical protein